MRLDERRKRGTNQLVLAERLDSKLGNPLNGAPRADVRIAAGGVLRVVEVAEVGEVPLEYRMELVTATGRMDSWDAT